MKTQRVTTTNIDRTLKEYDEGLDMSRQHLLGAEVGKSLRRPKSIKELVRQLHVDHNDDDSDMSDCEPNLKDRDDRSLSSESSVDSDFSWDENYDTWEPTSTSNDLSDGELASGEESDSDNDESFSDDEDIHANSVADQDDLLRLPKKYVEASSLYEAKKYTIPDEESLKNPPERVKFKNSLTETEVALVDLANLLPDRTKTDKKLFDDIAQWASHWSKKNKNIWTSYGRSNVWNRDKLVRSLTKTLSNART